jgi:hypothetical protein
MRSKLNAVKPIHAVLCRCCWWRLFWASHLRMTAIAIVSVTIGAVSRIFHIS